MTYPIKLTPKTEREARIAKSKKEPISIGEPIFDFRSAPYSPPVIRLPIDLPVYRMSNCRTFSEQHNRIATKGLDTDYFQSGQESVEAQTEQHAILSDLAKKGGVSVTPIYEVLESDGQREPILISSSGVVVNGNRRLSAMRELYATEKDENVSRFGYVDCAVLPEDATADEIDDLEGALQARPQTKLEYDWIGDAWLIKRDVNKGRKVAEIAKRLRRKPADVSSVLAALEEAELYLSEWAKKPGQYALVQEGEQIFADIPKKIKGQDAETKKLSRAIAWTIFDNKEQIQGRIYSLNAAFGKHTREVEQIFAEEVELPDIDVPDNEQGEFDVDFGEEDSSQAKTQRIIEALKNPEDRETTASALLFACQSAIEREKGKKSGEAALSALVQANSKIAGIDVATAATSTFPKMRKQIETIRNALDNIEVEMDKVEQ